MLWGAGFAALLLSALVTTVTARPAHSSSLLPIASRSVYVGAEELLRTHAAPLSGKRVGILSHAAGILPQSMQHIVDALHALRTVDIRAVYGPEHGFRGTAQAGNAEGFFIDARTGLKVYSTYLKRGATLLELFSREEVDLVVIDLQDVGARFYTYIWTLYDVLDALSGSSIEVIVLDRPNPLGGVAVEGPVLKAGFESGIGRKPLPVRHGMTLGELALLFSREFVANPPKVEVIRCQGWKRAMHWRETKLPWVPPSPNMPTSETANVYVGAGFIEGTNVSEGRGTTLPFELLGAAWANYTWADALRDESVPGLAVREAYFVPTFSKFANQTVSGVQLFVEDPTNFNGVRCGVSLLVSLRKTFGKHLTWVKQGTQYWIDLVSGSDNLRNGVDRGSSVDEILAGWQRDVDAFLPLRAAYLMYE